MLMTGFFLGLWVEMISVLFYPGSQTIIFL